MKGEGERRKIAVASRPKICRAPVITWAEIQQLESHKDIPRIIANRKQKEDSHDDRDPPRGNS
jgi:hypothetical protein